MRQKVDFFFFQMFLLGTLSPECNSTLIFKFNIPHYSMFTFAGGCLRVTPPSFLISFFSGFCNHV